ncbi:BnaC06g04680D [Brassica napus]|uniref:BnaC06g04680D protein n=1 Tax=Brassica napus TaxID=3708 RepID=A0A078IYY1_BRANA|nr:BnaC06g04680D [Brassica napus]
MSRDDSLATVVLRFTGTFPGELRSGCRRKRYTVDLSRVLQLLMELSSQRSSSCFPSPGSETAKLPHVAPFYSYGARVQGNSSSDLNLFGRSSLSSPHSELPSPLACPFLNGGSAYHHRTSLSTSGFDGHSACSGELVSPPVSTIYLSVDVYCTISDLQFRSTTSRTLLVTASEPKRYVPKWAWPNSFIEALSLSLFVVVVPLRLFFAILSTSALSDLWHRPHLLRWFGYGVTTRSSGGPRWRKWLACTVVVFSGRWRLLQLHRRRFELPGRESSSDSPSPAFSYGERRLPKFCASIWDPDVLWEKVTRLDLFHGRCGCRHGGFGSRRMRSQWKMMLSGEVTVFMKRKEMGHGSLWAEGPFSVFIVPVVVYWASSRFLCNRASALEWAWPIFII